MNGDTEHHVRISSEQFTTTTTTPTKSNSKCSDKPPATKWIKTGEVCRLFGVFPTTVRGWEQAGRLKAIRTPAGQRLYDLSVVQTLLDQAPPPQEVSTPQPTKENIIYCRVSSHHQKDDLQRQRDSLQTRYPTFRLVEDIGSGINFKRKGLQTILDLAIKGDLDTLVVAHKDRLCRFAFELIEYIITSTGGKILVLDHQDTKPLSSNEELAEDLLSIITVFNCRQMGRRRYQKHQDLLQASDGEHSEHS